VVTEVVNRSIGAQEQIPRVMRTESYQMARLIGTVSTNSQPILMMNTPTPTSVFPTLPRPPRIDPISTSSEESSRHFRPDPHALDSLCLEPMRLGPLCTSDLRESGTEGCRTEDQWKRNASQGAHCHGRNVSFQPRDFASTYWHRLADVVPGAVLPTI